MINNLQQSMTSLAQLKRRFLNEENGATAIEYSLIAGLIFIAIVSAVRGFTNETESMYDKIETSMKDANT